MKKFIIALFVVFAVVSIANGATTNTKNNEQFWSFTLESPADADDFVLFEVPYGVTITGYSCIVDPGVSEENIALDILECDANAVNCVSIDATTTCANLSTNDDGSLTNPSIDSGDYMAFEIGTASGTITQLNATIKYEEAL